MLLLVPQQLFLAIALLKNLLLFIIKSVWSLIWMVKSK